MAYREFTDEHGIPWEVWDVRPTHVERRREELGGPRGRGERRRSESGLRRTFQDIVDQLRTGHPVPPGVRSLVTIADDREPAPDGPKDRQTPRTPASDVYFPLPSNAEQQEIAARLATRRVVLVQGPPGTGKSHTIANLVCHLLATGQRVLVTSHTARALSVLQDKLPKETRPLPPIN